jgi:hypothetical protein
MRGSLPERFFQFVGRAIVAKRPKATVDLDEAQFSNFDAQLSKQFESRHFSAFS